MPRRRCVGCGRRAPKPHLLRLVLDRASGERRRVLIDARATLPGRGAYVCAAGDGEDRALSPDPDCLSRATDRGGLSRALRSPLSTPVDFVESTCP